jgi:hypothetical protein
VTVIELINELYNLPIVAEVYYGPGLRPLAEPILVLPSPVWMPGAANEEDRPYVILQAAESVSGNTMVCDHDLKPGECEHEALAADCDRQEEMGL